NKTDYRDPLGDHRYRIDKVFQPRDFLHVPDFEDRSAPFGDKLNHNLKRHDPTEIGFEEMQVLHNAAVLRNVIHHVGHGFEPPDAVRRDSRERDGSDIDHRTIAVHENIDSPEKAAHKRKVQVAEVTRCGGRQPGEYAGNHHEAHQEQRHNIKPGHNAEFPQNENVGAEKGEETNGYGKVREERCQSHPENDSANGLLFILGARIFHVILVQQVYGIGDTDSDDHRRYQSAEQRYLVTEQRERSQRPHHHDSDNDHGKDHRPEGAKEQEHDKAGHQGRCIEKILHFPLHLTRNI